MAAKSPHTLSQYGSNSSGSGTGTGHGSGNGSAQPQAPSASLGTAAVNRSSYCDLRPLSHSAHANTHTQNNGSSSADPSASSSRPQYHYAQDHHAQPLSSPDTHLRNHLYQQQQQPHDSYEQTQSNTLANAAHLYAPAPTRPTGKFTEEWDASQRGSSIIDAPLPRHTQNHGSMSSIQRSNSFSGSTSARGGDMDGANSIQMSRSNTLKKKSSLRRSGSLGRSGSRRSTKAGSVRSLALQSNADEDEIHSAFYCPVPTTGNPTEALANRFQGELDSCDPRHATDVV